jgi:hypothetical protein
MDSTLPSKDTIWQTGLKRKSQCSVVYKSPILLTDICTGLGWKAGRRFTKPMTPENRQEVAILISDKVDFKLTLVKWDKGHSILIKGAIHQKEITIINLYVPNVSAPNFTKHTLKDLKAHIDSNTVVVGDLYHQEINPRTKWYHLSMDLTDVYRILHPMTAQYTFFSVAHGTFSKIF